MKPVDSLNPSKKKKSSPEPNNRPVIREKPIRSSTRQKQASQKKKILTFWALVVFSAGVIFISWLFFLKVELKDASQGKEFGEIFTNGANRAMCGIKESLQMLEDINLEELSNTNQPAERVVDPEIKKLEEEVFPQFND